jgi:ATP-dependent protease ClpP protease subunit
MSTAEANQAYISSNTTTMHHLHINGEISHKPEVYQDHIQIFRQAKRGDEISIHLNTPGGSMYTTLQYINAMRQSEATITAHIEGICMSAGTFIFLAADKWLVHKDSLSMFHTYSAGYYGKGDEPLGHHEAVKKVCHSLMDDLYTGFLTEEELERVKNSRDDLFFTGPEMEVKIKAYAEYLSELERIRAEETNKQTILNSLPQLLEQEYFVEELAKLGYVKPSFIVNDSEALHTGKIATPFDGVMSFSGHPVDSFGDDSEEHD